MKEEEMKKIAEIFTNVIKALKDAKWFESKIEDKSDMSVFEKQDFLEKLNELKKEVLDLCERFPVYK